MVENAEDVPGETKPNFVEFFGDVKPPKVEAKPNIDGASVHVEASKYVGSGVLPLQAHEVDTARFFSYDVKSKDREELLEWARRQSNKAEFTIVTQRSIQCSVKLDQSNLLSSKTCPRLQKLKVMLDLGEDIDEYAWKTASYMSWLIRDDGDVGFMFRNMVEDNILYMYVRSICNCVEYNYRGFPRQLTATGFKFIGS
ncbi:hypothetical protein MTR_6g007833 [Medicago truncatula]|uniref:Uncharacterized protein n=1 Tax=Medicago truncatula TaxID=3880 RepID=A0A072U5H9_MEDTR|nr:hypothetical protein MTR_6g007833 [Medicago truncatula]